MPHPLTELLKEHLGLDRPGSGSVDQEDVDEEIPDELREGYSEIDDEDTDS